MKYAQKSFSIGGYSQDYADGWDRVFKPEQLELPLEYPDTCDACGAALLLTHPRRPDERLTCNFCEVTP